MTKREALPFFVQYVISVGDVYLISLPHTITNLPRKSVDK